MIGSAWAKGFGLGLAIAGVGFFAFRAWVVPPLVELLDPVVEWVQVLPGAMLHSDSMASFYIRTKKQRPGKPEFWVFFLVTEMGQGIPLDVFRAQPRSCEIEIPPSMVNHPPGTAWTQHYCFKLPERLNPRDSFQIVGEIGHKAWPFDSVVVSKLPAFRLVNSPEPYHNPFGGLH